jgi:hypothetical protein
MTSKVFKAQSFVYLLWYSRGTQEFAESQNNKCIFTKLNAVFILNTAAWKKNITTVNSVTNTWSIQQTPVFHGCTITNKQNVEPRKISTSWGHTKVPTVLNKFASFIFIFRISRCPFPFLWRHSSMTSNYVSFHISCLMKENTVLNF